MARLADSASLMPAIITLRLAWVLFSVGLSFLGGYLVGSIPVGLLLSRWHADIDIRRFGTGNIGAANVLRNGRPSAGRSSWPGFISPGLAPAFSGRATLRYRSRPARCRARRCRGLCVERLLAIPRWSRSRSGHWGSGRDLPVAWLEEYAD